MATLLALIPEETGVAVAPSPLLHNSLSRLLTQPRSIEDAVRSGGLVALSSQKRVLMHGLLHASHASPSSSSSSSAVLTLPPGPVYCFLLSDGLVVVCEEPTPGKPSRVLDLIDLRKACLGLHPVVTPAGAVDVMMEVRHAGGCARLTCTQTGQAEDWVKALRRSLLSATHAYQEGLRGEGPPLTDATAVYAPHEVITGTLFTAALWGNALLVSDLLALPPSPLLLPLGFACASKDDHGNTPLHCAAASGNVRACVWPCVFAVPFVAE